MQATFSETITFFEALSPRKFTMPCQPPAFAFTNGGARQGLLKIICVLCERTATLVPPAPTASAAALCVAAVCSDMQQRMIRLGGRESMPRSLGSLYTGLVVLFLGTTFSGTQKVIATRRVNLQSNGIAVTRERSLLLVGVVGGPIHVFRVQGGAWMQVVGREGSGPLQFNEPSQIHVSADDFVFVADSGNHRVQVLTARLDFCGFIGDSGQLFHPVGVWANSVIVAVTDRTHRVSVFARRRGALLRRFGSLGSGDGHLRYPRGICAVGADCNVAVADYGNHRISLFSMRGLFIRHVGAGALYYPCGVACSAFDELIVADFGNDRVVVFDAGGGIQKTVGNGWFVAVALHGNAIFAQDTHGQACISFS